MSRLARAGARARQVWVALRTNPYVERYEQVRRRNEDPLLDAEDDLEDEDGEPIIATDAEPPPDGVPFGIKVAAGWSWRLLIIAAAVIGTLYLADLLAVVVIPVIISILLAAMLQPTVAILIRWNVPRSLAALVVLVAGLGAVAGVLTYVINQFIDGVPGLVVRVQEGVQKIQDWAKEGPMHLEQRQIDNFFKQLTEALNDWFADDPTSTVETGVVTLGVAFNVLAGLFLVLFTTFFFLRDGRRIWTFLARLLPEAAEEPLFRAGQASWRSLVSFVRATILVAIIDAVFIGAGLLIMDVKLAVPLAALVFMGAFVPIIGATVSGGVAVLVALVSDNWVTALIVLGVVLVVQQVEGHVLQPLLMGRAVRIHPLAVVLAVGAGVVLAGVIGALIAVPVVAVVNAAVRQLTVRAVVAESDPPGTVAP
jgi:predicted PurR-regulated permease PerM